MATTVRATLYIRGSVVRLGGQLIVIEGKVVDDGPPLMC